MNAVKLYSKFNALPQTINKTIINQKLHLLKFQSHENLFEVGCGTGASARTLLKYIPHNYNKFVATDVLHAMVVKGVAENINNIQFDELDITTKKPLKKEWIYQFDKVFSFCALQFLPRDKYPQCFANINRLLKINGTLFIVIVGDNPIHETYKNMYKNEKWQPYYMHSNEFVSPYNQLYYDREEYLKNVLKQSEHEILDFDYTDIDHQFESINDFKNTVKAINPFVSRIPFNLHNDYWNDFWKLHEIHCDVMKTLQLRTRVLFLCARKVKNV